MTGDTLEKMKFSFLCFEAISLIISVLLIERFIYILSRKYCGHSKTSLILLFLLFLSKTVGLTSTFTFGNIGFKSEKTQIRGKEGAINMIISYVFSMICIILSYFQLQRLQPVHLEAKMTISKKILWKILILLFVSLVFFCVSMSQDWISFNDETISTETLMPYSLSQYSCYTGHSYCASSLAKNLRYCNGFNRLFTAQTVYWVFMELGSVFLALWIEYSLFYFRSISFGFEYCNYFAAFGSLLSWTLALVFWFHYSQAGYSNNCKVVAGALDLSFCAESGSIFGIISCILIGISGISYMIVFYYRNRRPSKFEKNKNNANEAEEPNTGVSALNETKDIITN